MPLNGEIVPHKKPNITVHIQ